MRTYRIETADFIAYHYDDTTECRESVYYWIQHDSTVVKLSLTNFGEFGVDVLTEKEAVTVTNEEIENHFSVQLTSDEWGKMLARNTPGGPKEICQEELDHDQMIQAIQVMDDDELAQVIGTFYTYRFEKGTASQLLGPFMDLYTATKSAQESFLELNQEIQVRDEEMDNDVVWTVKPILEV